MMECDGTPSTEVVDAITLPEDVDAWVSFPLEDPPFQPSGGPYTEASLEEFKPDDSVPDPPSLADITDADADFADFLIEDIGVDENLCASVSHHSEVPPGDGVSAINAELIALQYYKKPLEPHHADGVAESLAPGGDNRGISPPRPSLSASSDQSAESLGSNHRYPQQSQNFSPPSDARPCSPMEEISHCPVVGSGIMSPDLLPGGGRPLDTGQGMMAGPLYPGYALSMPPGATQPLVYPPVPHVRSLPRRSRKASGAQSGKKAAESKTPGHKDRRGKPREVQADEASPEAPRDGAAASRQGLCVSHCQPLTPEQVAAKPLRTGEARTDGTGGAPDRMEGTGSGGEGGRPGGCSWDGEGGVEPGVRSGEGPDSDSSEDGCAGKEDPEWEKRQARLMRNRESAQLSRQRKKFYMEELEVQLRTMSATVAELQTTIAHLTAENVNLRRQLAYFCPSGTAAPGPAGGPLAAGSLPLGPGYAVAGIPGAVPGCRPPVMGYRGLYPAVTPVVPIPKLKNAAAATSASKQAQEEKKRKGGSGQGAKGGSKDDKPSQAAGGGKVKAEEDGASDETRRGTKRAKAAPAMGRSAKASVAVLGVFGFLMLLSPLLPSFDRTAGGASISGIKQPGFFGGSAAVYWPQLPSARGVWGSKSGLGVSQAISARSEPSRAGGRVLMSVEESGWSAGHRNSSRPPLLRGDLSSSSDDSAAYKWRRRSRWQEGNVASGLSGQRLRDGHTLRRAGANFSGSAGQAFSTAVGQSGGSRSVRLDGGRVVRTILTADGAAIGGGAGESSDAVHGGDSTAAAKGSRGPAATLLPGAPGSGSSLTTAITAVDKAAAFLPLLPHQLKYLAMGAVARHQQQQQQVQPDAGCRGGGGGGSRVWALASTGDPVNGGAGQGSGEQSTSGAGFGSFKGSFFGSEMCTEIFQFEATHFRPEPTASGASPTARNSTASAPGSGESHDGAGRGSGVPRPRSGPSRRLGVGRWQHLETVRGESGGSGSHSGDSSAGLVPGRILPVDPTGGGKAGQATAESSVVVSILAGVDADPNAPLGKKHPAHGSGGSGLSKVFVVVLINGVKYITYACLLPTFSLKGPAPLVPV